VPYFSETIVGRRNAAAFYAAGQLSSERLGCSDVFESGLGSAEGLNHERMASWQPALRWLLHCRRYVSSMETSCLHQEVLPCRRDRRLLPTPSWS
jgi:hypothetical protein